MQYYGWLKSHDQVLNKLNDNLSSLRKSTTEMQGYVLQSSVDKDVFDNACLRASNLVEGSVPELESRLLAIGTPTEDILTQFSTMKAEIGKVSVAFEEAKDKCLEAHSDLAPRSNSMC